MVSTLQQLNENETEESRMRCDYIIARDSLEDNKPNQTQNAYMGYSKYVIKAITKIKNNEMNL